MNPKYNESPFYYKRRTTREVKVGGVGIGGNNPIRIQSMITSNTRDTEASISQIAALEKAGSELVRLTVPSQADADNLPEIRKRMKELGLTVPLVADIHFTPQVALKCVEWVEKVRINPGNFADKKKFDIIEYTDREYEEELERIEEVFTPLVLRARELGVAMRIGTNHGSLSDRIMNRFGDTPQGMVESALEFIRIAERNNYKEIVVSMKASNPQVMVSAYRLLVSRFYELGMDYPLHLGVTEAGDGKDGRIKSAIGIGSLLEEGLGDTIRVSLTEEAIEEIPVAKEIAKKYNSIWAKEQETIFEKEKAISVFREFRDPYEYSRFYSRETKIGELELGDKHPVRVETEFPFTGQITTEEILKQNFLGNRSSKFNEIVFFRIQDEMALAALSSFKKLGKIPNPVSFQLTEDLTFQYEGLAEEIFSLQKWVINPFLFDDSPGNESDVFGEFLDFIRNYAKDQRSVEFQIEEKDFSKIDFLIKEIRKRKIQNVFFSTPHSQLTTVRRFAFLLKDSDFPIVLSSNYDSKESALYDSSIHLGGLLLDGIGDLIRIRQEEPDPNSLIELTYDILQATRLRLTKTEYISCPSCGRTMFDLQSTTAVIKSKTGHLKGVKIAVMGCIVNGPGEMADADFGYVGAGVGKVHLYRGKEIVMKGVAETEAADKLIELIKSNGMWVDPEN
ncbi:4-hydroxy-3-methylbut-2-en-1-yl diphosphate synthase (flavodoxin) [Leptospira kobayashii]|uniref:4-hydroxy-3-methylbut-2-en-1-yl diphosphate synthase (flavodoxin) n=1 Tax=Leptospira kobayashii TaxID=1917830 RepID=A0ABN6KE97_9LEPT|nr:(E)-4-hydroxy-3-methylbut-2-enyl-diphosphate synthase [Leptospira kobayashii]BDA79354.1 4-hydroxy-3-methylbut-2-en-1-yl diphosphate synthase (flavodoxin) [Leptospira kobayashii]